MSIFMPFMQKALNEEVYFCIIKVENCIFLKNDKKVRKHKNYGYI